MQQEVSSTVPTIFVRGKKEAMPIDLTPEEVEQVKRSFSESLNALSIPTFKDFSSSVPTQVSLEVFDFSTDLSGLDDSRQPEDATLNTLFSEWDEVIDNKNGVLHHRDFEMTNSPQQIIVESIVKNPLNGKIKNQKGPKVSTSQISRIVISTLEDVMTRLYVPAWLKTVKGAVDFYDVLLQMFLRVRVKGGLKPTENKLRSMVQDCMGMFSPEQTDLILFILRQVGICEAEQRSLNALTPTERFNRYDHFKQRDVEKEEVKDEYCTGLEEPPLTGNKKYSPDDRIPRLKSEYELAQCTLNLLYEMAEHGRIHRWITKQHIGYQRSSASYRVAKNLNLMVLRMLALLCTHNHICLESKFRIDISTQVRAKLNEKVKEKMDEMIPKFFQMKRKRDQPTIEKFLKRKATPQPLEEDDTIDDEVE